ncbi:MAG: MBOAT family O-acyltransferase [Actinomycetota bacterium]
MLDFNTFDYFAWLLAACVVVAPLYYLMPWGTARRALLTALGAYLIFSIAPRLLVFYVIFWTVVVGLQRLIAWYGERPRAGLVLGASIISLLAPLVIWKLIPDTFVVWFNVQFNEIAWDISSFIGAIDEVRDVILPIGMSFAVFRAIDLLIQTNLGALDGLSPGRIYFYGFFPTVQIIGPVIEYSEVSQRGRNAPPRWPSIDDLSSSFALVVTGFVKVFVLAFPLEQSTDVFVFYESNSSPILWFELFLFAWFFYWNFAGYSDLSIGVARLFGFKLKPNFNNPYFRTNTQDYWNNWHMSLTRFAQRNVFTPLGGMRENRQYIAITATIMVIALWHDITWPLVIFGLYHASALVGARMMNKWRPADPDPGLPLRVGKNLAMFVFVMLGLPLLILDLGALPDFYAALVGA